jgi:hypothetical protein
LPVAFKASAIPWWALIPVAGLKVTLLTRLMVAGWALFTRLAGLELAAWCCFPWLALFARLEIPVVPLRARSALIAVVARLILTLFARLEFTLRLFLTFSGALTIDACFRLPLSLWERAFLFALFTVCFGLVKATETGISDAELFLGGCNQAEIMLGMLKEAFGRHMITGCLRIATELHVFFGNILGRTTHFDVGAV